MPSHSIVRVGKLEAPSAPSRGGGGSPSTGRVQLAPGDDFDGRSSVAAVAQVVAQVLARPEAVNASLSVMQVYYLLLTGLYYLLLTWCTTY